MMSINISDHSKEKFAQLLNLYHGNTDDLVNSMIEYKLGDLKRGIRNIEIDLALYEKKYKMDSQDFYHEFISGNVSDENDDFLKWSGEYEVLVEFKNELKQLS